jgi:hypothetical protein
MTERTLRAVILLLGVYHLATGLLALVAPGTFFDEIGRYGAENLHYVGDVGAFTAAYGVALLLAASRPSWWAPVLAVGAIWYALHALNHAFDVDEARSDARGLADTLLLALGAVALGYLAWVAERLRAAEPAR